MLFPLCTFITALACVSGQRMVTQKPSILTLSKGETATLHCQIPTDDSNYIYWYKQVPGGAPQFVLYYYRTHSSPTYGSGFSSSRFTSRAQSNTDYQLVISSVELGDSAVYYCKKWFGSPTEAVFGQGTKLIVSDPSLEAPSLTLLPPSSEELKAGKATLVCLAKMSAAFADVSWKHNGSPLTNGVFTSSATQQADKTFGLSSFLSVKPSEWDSDGVFTCKVTLGAKSTVAEIKKSNCAE
ncbi:immunoglobulin lambda-1 light chain-like isoform X4 [Brienomyrus brachyistius]|uniref:immunoglobulin lambda-1 light chain-like isoform X4 n=1 Tax=Brienomyrus brachyistius TaxID=42636 RepID=UPI0020B426F5|nr:immunoglobulin lambda-1 light chain-like isoform X4 [Brienomyrus brachyistius]